LEDIALTDKIDIGDIKEGIGDIVEGVYDLKNGNFKEGLGDIKEGLGDILHANLPVEAKIVVKALLEGVSDIKTGNVEEGVGDIGNALHKAEELATGTPFHEGVKEVAEGFQLAAFEHNEGAGFQEVLRGFNDIKVALVSYSGHDDNHDGHHSSDYAWHC